MKRALLVIDVQNEYFTGKLPVSYPENSFSNILQVMDAAKANDVPVVVVQHSATNSATFNKGSAEWELRPEIAERPYDHYIEKTLPGTFTGTDLEEWLKANEIDTVVISGYMTQHCCDTTARQAFHLGYNVEFLSDATGTLAFTNAAGSVTAEELHRAILVAQQVRMSKVISSADWIEKISQENAEATQQMQSR
ncbi:MAG TPA: cysteine hydrolase family protein [Chloroflexia bacterium]|nr:cysteine hydrolase family protein [Chloroflexia bacterium]